MRVKIAAEQGAGTLVYVGRFDLAEFAVVLEPDEPLRTARRALLCRHGGAGRCAARLRAAGEADRDRLAGCDPRRWRAGRRRAARLAARRERGRAAGLAGVRRHDPHRVDDRRASRACIRWRRRSRKKASTMSAAAELVESFARHLMVAHRCLAGGRLRRRRAGLSAAAAARKRRAPRHRRERRSAGAARGQDRGRAA